MNAFMHTFFASSVFSSVLFSTLYAFKFSSIRSCSSYPCSGSSFRKFSPTNTSPTIYNTRSNASRTTLVMAVGSSPARESCVRTDCGLDGITARSSALVQVIRHLSIHAQIRSFSIKSIDRHPDVETTKLIICMSPQRKYNPEDVRD